MEQAPEPAEANEADVADQLTPADGLPDDDPTDLSPDEDREVAEDDEAHPRDGG